MTMKNFYDHDDDYGMFEGKYFEVINDKAFLSDEQDGHISNARLSDDDWDRWHRDANVFYQAEKKKLGVELRQALSQKPKKERDYNGHLKSISWNLNRIANVLEEAVPNNKTVGQRILRELRKPLPSKKRLNITEGENK